MDGHLLEPWMLRADGRDDPRACLIVDLATWPAELAIDPLPPVPLIGLGPVDHPQSDALDLIIEDGFSSAAIVEAIATSPRAAAVIVQLLRATEGIAPDRALTMESLAYATLQGGGEHRAWLATRTPSPAPPGALCVSRKAGRLDILLDRPAQHGAIDRTMRDALFDAFSLAALDDSIAEVRIAGTGRCFSIGADLDEFGTTRDPAEAHAIRMLTLPARAMLRRPAIYCAHVHGACIGSALEIVAFAGRLTATRDAWFQLPELAMGILPGAGGCVSIPRRIGRRRAALMMLSGKRVGADLALRWGLIDAIED